MTSKAKRNGPPGTANSGRRTTTVPKQKGLAGPSRQFASRPNTSVLRPEVAPAAQARGQMSSEPRVFGGFKSTRIVHRELIASVVGSSAFVVANTFPLNPGMALTFPWLSRQAEGWEQYVFRRLRFCYYSRTGSATPGSVLLVPDYDAADSAPSTEQIASSYSNVVEMVPWTLEFCCELDVKALLEPGTRKYVRSAALAPNLDIKTYDGGNFFVCTTDGTAVSWGKLWVEYDVEFFVPQLPPAGPGLTASSRIGSGGAVSKTSIYGTAPSVFGNQSVVPVVNTITFNSEGQFLVAVVVTGTAFSGTPPTVAGTAVAVLAIANVSATQAILLYTVVAVSGQTFSLDFSAVSGTVTSTSVRIAPYLASLG